MLSYEVSGWNAKKKILSLLCCKAWHMLAMTSSTWDFENDGGLLGMGAKNHVVIRVVYISNWVIWRCYELLIIDLHSDRLRMEWKYNIVYNFDE